MKPLKKSSVLGPLWLAACSISAAGMLSAHAAPGESGAAFEGNPVHIGNGTARVVVRVDPAGTLTSVGVKLTREALEGLPSELNKATSEGQWEYALPMPAKGPRTGYRFVAVDWNPQGHLPPHIYTVPHFDFHFYLVSAAEVAKVRFKGPSDPAAQVRNGKLVPSGYQVIPESVVDKMGVHAVDTAAPEFNGKPFTTTFIYGYYKERLTFVEPMATRDFLLGNPYFSAAVKRPAEYSISGYYPTRYTVRYEPRQKAYLVELNGLERAGAHGPSSAAAVK